MKYIGYYNAGIDTNRSSAPAGESKMRYIASVVGNIYSEVEVISLCSSIGPMTSKAILLHVADNFSVRFFTSLGKRNWITRAISSAYLRMQLWSYCLKRIKKSETIIVYHSLAYMKEFLWLKRIKKYKLILEMEEIYSDVIDADRLRVREYEYAKIADGYIFPTELLNERINTKNKPAVIIHGVYQTELTRGCRIFNANLQYESKYKIHCVYAGTLDPRKGGAITAASAAEFLSSNYHIHILGFGSEADKKMIQDLVDELAQKCACGISYDGVLMGEEYTRFIQSCDIGLSTQNPSAAFNATSFPSKVLSYLANGLHVVSIRIPAVEQSAVGELIYYYDEHIPQAIARAIQTVDLNEPYDSRARIRELDRVLRRDIEIMLNRLSMQ